jgi:hypothetical protein
MVEVDKRLKPACCTPAYDGAVINTDTDEVGFEGFAAAQQGLGVLGFGYLWVSCRGVSWYTSAYDGAVINTDTDEVGFKGSAVLQLCSRVQGCWGFGTCVFRVVSSSI